MILKKRNFKIADEEHPLCEYLIDINVVFPDFECAQRMIQTYGSGWQELDSEIYLRTRTFVSMILE